MKFSKTQHPPRRNGNFRINPVSAALFSACMLTQLVSIVHAEETGEPQEVIVTGSRITRANSEGPSSVTVITAADIEQKGYKSVYDALNNLPQNSGFTQGEDFGNTFTPAANALSLRGLGPNHTLVLLNGRRIADYPFAYEGSVNFANLSNIPSALIDRIEILNGGASAVYGSDAIAGVINIILKQHADGFDVSLKAGTTQRGGGDDQRLQISGGENWGKLTGLFGLEISNREPIWSNQRSFMATTSAYGEAPYSMLSRLNATTGKYIDPGLATCNQFGSLYDNSTSYYQTGKGARCASTEVLPSYWTIQTKSQSQNLFSRLTYDLAPQTELFSDVNVGFSTTKTTTSGPSWTSAVANGSQFLNQTTGQYESWSRSFAPEEIGGAGDFARQWKDIAGNFAFGIRAPIGSTSWNYEASYSGSIYNSDTRAPRFLSSIDNYFLGPQLGQDSSGVPIYAPNLARFNTPLTPAVFNSMIGNVTSTNKSWSQTVSLTATGDVLSLPAGPLKAATVFEVGGQGYSNTPDPGLATGEFYNSSAKSEVGGTRHRYAAGLELNAPLTKQLIATLAGRYDDYSFAGRNDSKFTYSGGLEFRPVSTLLFRGNYATSFRAPDMNYIYTAQTLGYYPGLADTYQCKLAGQPLGSCSITNDTNYTSTSNKDLKAESGVSFGAGVVWSPSSNFDVSVDYWSFNIKDEVADLQPQGILQDEADCRTGVLDINSSRCQDALARVVRYSANDPLNPGGIKMIYVNPINVANEKTTGYDISGKWKWKVENFGAFVWSANFTKTLTHTYQQDAGDPPVDTLNALGNTDWPDKLSTSLTWNINQWSSTLNVIRYGKISNGAQTGWLTPFALANFSTNYQVNKYASVALTINNVLNSVRYDSTGGWPYYPVGNFTPYGRQIWLSGNYHFGS